MFIIFPKVAMVGDCYIDTFICQLILLPQFRLYLPNMIESRCNKWAFSALNYSDSAGTGILDSLEIVSLLPFD